jgi:hypothetical protein
MWLSATVQARLTTAEHESEERGKQRDAAQRELADSAKQRQADLATARDAAEQRQVIARGLQRLAALLGRLLRAGHRRLALLGGVARGGQVRLALLGGVGQLALRRVPLLAALLRLVLRGGQPGLHGGQRKHRRPPLGLQQRTVLSKKQANRSPKWLAKLQHARRRSNRILRQICQRHGVLLTSGSLRMQRPCPTAGASRTGGGPDAAAPCAPAAPARAPRAARGTSRRRAMQRLHATAAAAAPTSAVRRIQADLACGTVSAVQVAQRYLDRLAEREPEVQSFITVAAESALDAAAALDQRLAAEGQAALGPLAGVPVGVKARHLRTTACDQLLLRAVHAHGQQPAPCTDTHTHRRERRTKESEPGAEPRARPASPGCSRAAARLSARGRAQDTLCTAGLATTAGAAALRGYMPPYDATAVARLRRAGALVLGKCNCDAFAMGSTTEASAYQARPRCPELSRAWPQRLAAPRERVFWPAAQVTRNPWDPRCVPGGSSGGSAAAVAAGQCVAALGSDTGACNPQGRVAYPSLCM